MNLVYIILGVLFILIIVILTQYNSLVNLQNRVKKSKANIEIYLKKRFDLIPNLVECVKGYSNHESNTLEEITSLRSVYKEQKNMSLKDAGIMNNQLNKYLAVVESYPELKANEQYLDLQKQLKEIEDQLGRARHIYNDVVTTYNTKIETVPSNIIASIFAFKQAKLFQIDSEQKENIHLDF